MASCKECICSEVCYYKSFNDVRNLEKRRNDVEKYCKSFVHRDSLKNAPTVDAVPREAYEQVKWERDQAMEQLAEHRIPFGGIAPDVVEVVRCKGCKHYDNSEGIQWCHLNSKFYPGGTDWHSFPEDGFCSYGERRTNGETETT